MKKLMMIAMTLSFLAGSVALADDAATTATKATKAKATKATKAKATKATTATDAKKTS
jgi:Ni/Co efflux regulator RcnB